MNLQKRTAAILTLALVLWQSLAGGQSHPLKDTVNFHFSVETAPEWDALFNRTSGWFGADGIFSIPLSGTDRGEKRDSVLFIFSDTMIGEIAGGKLQPGWSMVNNSVAYLPGSKPDEKRIRFFWKQDENGKPATFFVPSTPSAEKGDYYWLGDGFVNQEMDNATYIFAYRMRNLSDEAWSFSEMGNVLIKLPAGSRPPFKDQQQIETPLSFSGPEGKGSFGAGIFVNTESAGAPRPDGYVYVYGIRGKAKNLVVARVLPENFEDFSRWKYWDGKGWNADMQKSAMVAHRLSNELSVSALPDGRYALVFQQDGIGRVVGLRLGLRPEGPFGPVIKLWECTESQQKNIIVYNAKVHPALSKPGELLISYNVNAFDFMNEIKKQPNLYRPRFIRVKLK
ncbi:uncharacterized protein DUF4185 [Anseongella ginsenosidimutans]|uniref:Uncharacterized protein DUF4185 n=1 Tax=Anseongella ginsenosidimutans TaxID=496056 RepID=A0A4R3KQY7_9SPHI|nr:DUF4185 domain-containing protein [Anseongella ginsenosidimutans]QEC52577.1 DUF4185 domain-containing protein [Anseongella ginsenosidimutans]TCS86493.1 uncharacterized protein DUF4185 [Anseongella ginsenosidimutans]